MTDPIDEMIERSSLGTPEAKQVRSRVPDDAVSTVMRRLSELAEEIQVPDEFWREVQERTAYPSVQRGLVWAFERGFTYGVEDGRGDMERLEREWRADERRKLADWLDENEFYHAAYWVRAGVPDGE